MKKKLLITTALVAAFTATNAYTMEINTDTEITGEGQAIEPNEKLIVSGGKLVATDTHVYAEGVEVTGGTVILNDGASLKNDNWDESFKLSGGTIIMNGGGDGPSIGTNHSSEEESWEYRGGKFEMTGGNLIVNDSENYIEGGDVSISAGTVDIAEGATLQTAATLIPSGLSPEEGDDAMAGEVAVIKLTDEGTINLSGTLVSDVSGNGNLNVKSSSALVDGDVSGSNLTFEADHSLSKLVSGTIGDLASLNVNKGTLTYDKQTGKIGNMEISQDAGLKVENFVQDADSKDENSVRADNFTSDGNIMLSGSEGSSDITVQNALNITGGSVTVDTHTAILYGEYKPSNWYVNGIATYGWSDYSEDKNVAGVGVKADYDVETFGLQAMTGYDMQVKGFGFTPEAGLRYVHIKQDAYKDSADQKVSGNNSDILTGVIGAKVSKNFELSNGMNIKPEARIAATYDLFNDDVNSVVTLANGSAYAVNGEALDRFGMEFGAGVTAELNSQVELSLGYEGKFREDYQDHTGLINAKYKF